MNFTLSLILFILLLSCSLFKFEKFRPEESQNNQSHPSSQTTSQNPTLLFKEKLEEADLFHKPLDPHTEQALSDLKHHKVLENGLFYGETAVNFRFQNKSLPEIQAELKRLGMREHETFIKDQGLYDFLKDKHGNPIPMLIYVHPDGSIIRIKHKGNPASPFVPWPHMTISTLYPHDAALDNFSFETVKFDGKGHILPKWLQGLIKPYPAKSKELDQFITEWSLAAHIRLFPKVDSQILFPKDSPNKPLQSLLELFEDFDRTKISKEAVISFTQKHWLRDAGKERWDIKEKFSDQQKKGMALLEDLGMFRAFYPQEKYYDYAVVLGALVSTVRTRLAFLSDQWKLGVRFKHIVFLSGQRNLDAEKESDAILFDPDNKEFPFSKKTEDIKLANRSEIDMIRMVYEQSDLPEEMRRLPVLFVDAPARQDGGKILRPNTADTVAAWLRLDVTPGSCLVVSNNPYIGYQDAVLRRLLPQTFSIETVGPADSQKGKFALYLDSLARWIFSL